MIRVLTIFKEPFGARLDIEVINTPSPLGPTRNASDPYTTGESNMT